MNSSSARLNTFPRRVVGRVHNDGPRVGMEGSAKLGFVIAPLVVGAGRWAKLHKAGACTHKETVGAVILVKRLEDDDFIAWIADGQK